MALMHVLAQKEGDKSRWGVGGGGRGGGKEIQPLTIFYKLGLRKWSSFNVFDYLEKEDQLIGLH